MHFRSSVATLLNICFILFLIGGERGSIIPPIVNSFRWRTANFALGRKFDLLMDLHDAIADFACPDDPTAFAAHLAQAQSMVQDGKGDECMPRSAFWAPITAQRLVDLHAVDGTDDYFSSDLSDAQLAARLSAAGEYWSDDDNLQLLVAFSGADEYIKPGLDTAAHTERLEKACNAHRTVATGLHIPDGNHNLAVGNVALFLQEVQDLLSKSKGE